MVFHCPHHPLQGLSVRDTTSLWQDKYVVGQYALYCAKIKGCENVSGEVCSLQLAQKVNVLLSPLYKGPAVLGPGQCVRYDHFHSCVVNGEGCVAGLVLSEVHDNLFCFCNGQGRVVSFALDFSPPRCMPGHHQWGQLPSANFRIWLVVDLVHQSRGINMNLLDLLGLISMLAHTLL